jgi:BsuBI/PstI restriction endonuclease domain
MGYSVARMKRRITAADVQAALDGFVQAGLVCEFLATPSESPAYGARLEFHTPNRKRRRRRFGKRERALIKKIIEEFCPRFASGATVVYVGDAESKFLRLEAAYLAGLGVVIAPSAKMPDVVVHDTKRNWLMLVEAVTSAGAVDWKRRKELKELFKGCKAGLVFVTAFETRRAMQGFLPLISWETEVWVAEDPDHLIHFDGERFLGPYPDVTPGSSF